MFSHKTYFHFYVRLFETPLYARLFAYKYFIHIFSRHMNNQFQFYLINSILRKFCLLFYFIHTVRSNRILSKKKSSVCLFHIRFQMITIQLSPNCDFVNKCIAQNLIVFDHIRMELLSGTFFFLDEILLILCLSR